MAQLKVEKYFDIGCDVCAKHLSTDYEMGMYSTANEARMIAKDIGFRFVNSRNLCPQCYRDYIDSQNLIKARQIVK